MPPSTVRIPGTELDSFRGTKDLRANVPRSLYAAMIVQFAVGGSVIPFVTLLLRDRGLDYVRISHVLLASSATLLVFPFIWGMVADRFLPLNRLFGLLNLFVAAAVFFLSRQSTFLGLLAGVALFYACFHPMLTLINALSFHHLENPQEQFARLRAWGSAGWIIPSLPISLWLAFGLSSNLDFVLYFGFGFAIVMVVTSLFLPHTPPGSQPSIVQPGNLAGYWPAARRLLRDPNYLTILAAFFLVSASFSILIFYSPPVLEDLGVERKWIGPIQSIGVVLEITLFPHLPWFLRRWGYIAAVLTGCFALVARHLLYVFSDNPWVLSGSYLLAGMVIVFFHIGCSILINLIAETEVKATAQTLIVLCGSGLGPVFANGVAGLLAKRFGTDLHPLFLFASGLAAVAAVMILVRRKEILQGASAGARGTQGLPLE